MLHDMGYPFGRLGQLSQLCQFPASCPPSFYLVQFKGRREKRKLDDGEITGQPQPKPWCAVATVLATDLKFSSYEEGRLHLNQTHYDELSDLNQLLLLANMKSKNKP